MFSSDACCFRNGQLKQLNDGEGWEKQEHFIHAKTLEKNSCKPEWKQNKKHLQKIQPPALPFLLYTIFHEKGTPFNTLFRTLYPFWLLYISALFFFLHRNQSQKWPVHRRCLIFLFVPTPLHWRSINPLRFIFYHPRSVDFEKEIEGLWTGYLKNRTFSRLFKAISFIY